jgi:hypothetical protein
MFHESIQSFKKLIKFFFFPFFPEFSAKSERDSSSAGYPDKTGLKWLMSGENPAKDTGGPREDGIPNCRSG